MDWMPPWKREAWGCETKFFRFAVFQGIPDEMYMGIYIRRNRSH